MEKLNDWLRRNFKLRAAERPEEEDFEPDVDIENDEGEVSENSRKELNRLREAFAIKAAILRIGQNPEIVQRDAIEDPSKEYFMAMLAAAYAILRKNDEDWKALEPEISWRLWIGAVIVMAHMALGEKK